MKMVLSSSISSIGGLIRSRVCQYLHSYSLKNSLLASGGFDLEKKPGRGRRSSLGNEDLERAVEANPEPNTPTLPEDLGVHHRHLAEIGKVKKISRRVPHELTEE
ncbi:hypothetical protein RB195_020039 [Necator americanus]|uniref:Uncharacterized protein n=1 Tax=Necator americanus TaxID=51031 RepID=A0ABR1CJ41_NECAM